MQGFRTRPTDFKALLELDKSTIKGVVQEIKRQLDATHH
jgi:hypothetical protein